MKEPSLQEGEEVLLFLNRRSRPYSNHEDTLLQEGQFTIAGPAENY